MMGSSAMMNFNGEPTWLTLMPIMLRWWVWEHLSMKRLWDWFVKIFKIYNDYLSDIINKTFFIITHLMNNSDYDDNM